MSDDRKPTPPEREPAQTKLNHFLKENNILIGTDRPQIDFGGSGSLVIYPPRIIAVYKDETKQKAVN